MNEGWRWRRGRLTAGLMPRPLGGFFLGRWDKVKLIAIQIGKYKLAIGTQPATGIYKDI